MLSRDERGVLDEETRLLLQSLSPTRLCHTLDAPCMVMASTADGVSLHYCFASTPSLLSALCLVDALALFHGNSVTSCYKNHDKTHDVDATPRT